MKSCCSVGTLWVLLEVPPHGCCPPWSETIRRVAEWCNRNAGRRSAGLGSEGAAQGQSHAGGVRAHGSVRIPQKGGGDMTDGAICSASVHWWFLTGRK